MLGLSPLAFVAARRSPAFGQDWAPPAAASSRRRPRPPPFPLEAPEPPEAAATLSARRRSLGTAPARSPAGSPFRSGAGSSMLLHAAVRLTNGLGAVALLSAFAAKWWSRGRRATRVAARAARRQPNSSDGGVAVIDKARRTEQVKEFAEEDKWWRVVLHNDGLHTFEYVTVCLTEIVQHLSRRRAYAVTWEAHCSGQATVTCVWKALAEQLCADLQRRGLTVSAAPDSKFQGSKRDQ